MKRIFISIVVLSLLSLPAFAKTFKLPNDESAVATIDFPKDWEPEATDNGVWGQSPDTAVYLSAVAVGSDKGMKAEIDDTFEMLKEHKVQLDTSTKKEQKFKLNGADVDEMLYQGKDEDGPCAISICFIPMKDKLIVLTYWVSTEKEKEHQPEVGKILQSIKPAA